MQDISNLTTDITRVPEPICDNAMQAISNAG